MSPALLRTDILIGQFAITTPFSVVTVGQSNLFFSKLDSLSVFRLQVIGHANVIELDMHGTIEILDRR